ncbi:chitosanase [Roseateles chitinivorans]|uniref:chitosanase n=1 Tax=Roseateles chitinivorans TaxID=2917965 RepID=UPI003D6644E8
MAHIERITDVPSSEVDEIRSSFEQRGATVQVIAQGNDLFTLEATYPGSAKGIAGLGTMGVLSAGLAAKAIAATEAGAGTGAGARAGADPAAAGSPVLTATQSQTAKAIVNIFETSAVLGRYDQVTLIPGDSGHLTYGRSQTTLGSGLLHDLLALYATNPGARFAKRLAPYLPRTAALDLSLDTDATFANVLRACGDDLVMRETQDVFFDTRFWTPAVDAARRLGLTLPLSVAVVYDSRVHGSWDRLRDETTEKDGSLQKLGERGWIQAYVKRRLNWLATSTRDDLRATVYRMDAFQRLIDQDRWGLALPLVVRGLEISTATLSEPPPGCYAGPTPGTRPVAVTSPLTRGLDVRLLQLALSDAGEPVKADGVFGDQSSKSLARVQSARGMPASGVADPAQVVALVQPVFG